MNVFYEYMYDSGGRLLKAIQENSQSIPHFHSCYEVLYVLEGEVTATVNGVSETLREGDLYVVGSFDIHKTQTDRYSRCLVVIIPEEFLSGFNQIARGRVFGEHFLKKGPYSDEIRRCLLGLLTQAPETGPLPLRCRGYLYVVFGIFAQTLPLLDEAAVRGRPLPRDILLYLQQHFDGRLTLAGTAARFGYSTVYFSRFFRRYFGCGFNEYVNMLRVQHAASLFGKRATFLDAALESGFENQRTFNREFKRIFGKTPSEYRDDFAG